VNNESVRTWKEAVEAYFEAITWNFLRETE
jgi:hypothetical protein